RADRVVSVPHGVGGGRIHSGFAGTRFSGGGDKADLPASVADGPGLPAGGAAAAAIAPWTPGTFLRNVSDAAQNVGDGHVRLCVPVVSDGGSGVGDMARLSTRHRGPVAIHHRME